MGVDGRSVNEINVVIISLKIFKASSLWADAFYRLKCLSVCLCVCVSVCSLFEVPFQRLFAPTSRSQMSKNFRDSKSLGKSCARSGLRFEHFCSKMVKNCRGKKSFFSLFLFVQF